MTYIQLIADCWSRGFAHAEYIDWANQVGDRTKINPHTVSEAAYNLIYQGLTLDMEQSIDTEQPDSAHSSVYTDEHGNPYN